MAATRKRHPKSKKRLRRDFSPAVIFFAIIVFILILNLPTPDGLTTEGKKAIAIFCVAILLWVSHALPLMITSLLVIILFPLTGVLSTHASYALFGNEAIFFILGAFILASGIMRSGLSSRIALIVLRFFGKTPNNLVLSFLCLSGFLSFWMSEHAVAAMMFPIVFEVVDALKLSPLKSNFGKTLFLAMTWGCIIGGVATFLGGARAPLAIGLLRQLTNSDITFLQWMIAALPTVIIMLFVAYFFLTRFYPSEVKNISQAHLVLKRKQLRIGRTTKREKQIGALMILTVMVWIFWGDVLGLANIAIGSVVIAFALKLLDWKEVEEDVNWGIFLMYGGAISLGYAMEMTGAAHWLAEMVLGGMIGSGWMVVVALTIISLFLTEAISNTAVVALLLPIALGIAVDHNLDPRVITLIVTIPCGLAFQLPMGTPATAIAFSSGFVRLSDTVISGFILKIIALIIFLFTAIFYWPLIGLNL